MTTGTAPTPKPASEEYRPPSDKPFLVGLVVISSVYVILLIALLVGDVAYMATGDLADTVALPGWLEWARPVLRPLLSMVATLGNPEIRYSVQLTMVSCLFSAVLSLFVAVPTSYLLSRHDFPGKNLLDAILDIPIVLPPLVVGLSLLILFQFVPDVTIGERSLFWLRWLCRLGALLSLIVLPIAFLNLHRRRRVAASVILLGCGALAFIFFVRSDNLLDIGTYSLRNAIVFQVPAVVLAQFMVAAAFAVRVMRATFCCRSAATGC